MKAYLVLGPESSGTRLLTRQLMAAGCEGCAEHIQPFDAELPPAQDRAVVWRRSVPHSGVWVDIPEIVNQLKAAGYQPRILVNTRSWYATTLSQVKAGHVTSRADAIENLRRAYPHIFDGVIRADVPYFMVSYETLVMYPRQVLRYAFDTLGWPYEAVPVHDENVKWFEE